MGGGVSSSVFDFKYQKERSELRKALILSFVGDPANQDVLARIAAVRSIIIQNPHLCATAAREAATTFECSPTSLDAANNELDRLFTIYETGTILKSVQCRISNVACPIGHYAPYFGDPLSHPLGGTKKKKNKILCNVCDKACQSGHNCSYCEYTMCVPCSPIYCSYGHACKLWTHPEAQHVCAICKKQPITSGYHCPVCEDYDICDMCTAKPGRKFVQDIILDRMKEYVDYMKNHLTESETAAKTYAEHKRKLATNEYATTLELYEFSVSLHAIKDICLQEVFMTRTIKEVNRLRKLLSYGKKHSVTAMRESLKEGDYTNEEIMRLRILVDWSEREKSQAVRMQHIVACPLGHAAHHFTGRPLQYLRRDANLTTAQKASQGKNLAICKVCDRVAAPEGFHCDFCEYDLCVTCSVIYCRQGHAMTMWTLPEAREVDCVLCDRVDLSSGYHCSICNEDVCDMSTSREGRGDIRKSWEKEMNEIMVYMKANKRLSGVAQFYNWRHANYIVSIGLLCEYVRELRTAKKSAENQVEQKPIIDKIKEFRAEIARDVAYSAMAVRETARPEHYIYRTKKKAAEEATRLMGILQFGYMLQTIERRCLCGIACPLGHGMSPLDSDTLSKPYPPLPTTSAASSAKAKALSAKSGKSGKSGKLGGAMEAIGENMMDTASMQSGKSMRSTKVMNMLQAEPQPLLVQLVRGQREGEEEEEEEEEGDRREVEGERRMTQHEQEQEQDRGMLLLGDIPLEPEGSAALSGDTDFAHKLLVKDSEIIFQDSQEIAAAPAKKRHQHQHQHHHPNSSARLGAGEGSSGLSIGFADDGSVLTENTGDYGERSHVPRAAGGVLGNSGTSRRNEGVDAGVSAPQSRKSEGAAQSANKGEGALVLRKADADRDRDRDRDADADARSFDESSVDPDMSVAVSEAFTEDEETRLMLLRLPRLCRVCGAEDLVGGHFCPLCEYDLCAACSTVYCRMGHPLKIWTYPEATTLCCDMCKKAPIQSGYRCLVCEIDVCDMCTTKDSRNAFMLWPRRELTRIMALLQECRDDSEIAASYLAEQEEQPQQKLDSMSILCKKLKEAEQIKVHVDEEIRLRKLKLRAKHYGIRGSDM
jgi:hypothetical protein